MVKANKESRKIKYYVLIITLFVVVAALLWLLKGCQKEEVNNQVKNTVNVQSEENNTVDETNAVNQTNNVNKAKEPVKINENSKTEEKKQKEKVIDNTAPTIIVEPTSSTVANTEDITITVADETELNENNKYEYQLGESNTEVPNGDWQEYISGEEFTIGEGITGTRYIWVKEIKDTADNKSNNENKTDTYHVYGTYVFDNTAPEITIGEFSKQYIKNASEASLVLEVSEKVTLDASKIKIELSEEENQEIVEQESQKIAKSVLEIQKISESEEKWKVTITGGNDTEKVSIKLEEGLFIDDAGNKTTTLITPIVIVDNIAPLIEVTPNNCQPCQNTQITIKVEEQGKSGLLENNQYEYQLGNAVSVPEGEWRTYTSGREITIGEGITGSKYIWVKAIKDKAENTSKTIGGDTVERESEIVEGKAEIIEYHVYGPYEFDNEAPRIFINNPSKEVIKEGSIATYRVTTSEDVILVNPEKIAITGAGALGSTIEITGEGKEWIITVTAGKENGEAVVLLNIGLFKDQQGNIAEEILKTGLTIDNTVPTVTIEDPSKESIKYNDQVTYQITTNEIVTVNPSKIEVIGEGAEGCTTQVTGAGRNWVITVIGGIANGDAILKIGANGLIDMAGNGNEEITKSGLKMDNISPAITIGEPSKTKIKQGVKTTYGLTISEDVTLKDVSKITITGEGATQSSVTITGNQTSWTVSVTGGTGNGEINLAIGEGAFQDEEGNDSLNASKTGVILDNTVPTITIGEPNRTAIRQGVQATYNITTSESVTVDATKIQITGEGATQSSVTITGNETRWIATVTAGNIDGEVALELLEGLFKDPSENQTALQTKLGLRIDNTKPTITIGEPSKGIINNGGKSIYQITTSEPVLLRDATKISITGEESYGSTAQITGEGTSWTVTVTGGIGNGEVALQLGAGLFKDMADNQTETIEKVGLVIENSIPLIEIQDGDKTSIKVGETVIHQLIVNKNVELVDSTKVKVIGEGSQGCTTQITGSNKSWEVEITAGQVNGSITLELEAGVFVDAAGNATEETTKTDVIVDNTKPTIQMNGTVESELVSNEISFTIPLKVVDTHAGITTNQLTASDIQVKIEGEVVEPTTKYVGYNTNQNGEYRYTLTLGGFSALGEITLEIPADGIEDKAGNKNEGITIIPGVTVIMPAAQMGSKYYRTLASAVETAGLSQTTIKILNNTDEAITIPMNKNIIIDLNSKTIESETTTITNNGILTIKGNGNIESTGTAIQNNNKLTVTSGRIAGNVGINSTIAGTITIGTKSYGVSQTNPEIAGETNGINTLGGTLNLYDGVIKGKTTAINGEITQTETDYELVDVTESGYNTVKLGYVYPVITEFTNPNKTYIKKEQIASYTIKTNKNVEIADSTKVLITGAGAEGCTVEVAGSGKEWEARLTAGSQTGAVTLQLQEGLFIDEEETLIPAMSKTGLIIDNQSPVVSVTTVEQTKKLSETVTLTMNFSDALSRMNRETVSAEDVKLMVNGEEVVVAAKTLTKSNYYSNTYTLTLVGVLTLETGPLQIVVESGSFEDNIGNTNVETIMNTGVTIISAEASVTRNGETTYYENVNKAIQAVPVGEESSTVKILADYNGSLSIDTGKNIKLDLNGKTIIGSYGIENRGTLEITDGIGGGIVEGTTSYGIRNLGILKIYGGEIYGKTKAIDGDVNNVRMGYEYKEETVEEIFIGKLVECQESENENVIAKVEREDKIYYYTSVQNAIISVGDEKETVVVLKNSEETLKIYVNRGVILDLNGKMITGQSNRGVDNYGTLEITDSAEGGIITVTRTSGYTNYGVYNNSTGSITISGGTITVSSNTTAYGIYNASSNETIISNIVINLYSEGNVAYGIYNESIGKITIVDATISTSSNATYWIGTSYAVYNNNTGIVEITSGIFNSYSKASKSYGVYNNSIGSVIMKEGIITASSEGTLESNSTGIYNNSTGNIIIDGGTINATSMRESYGVYNNSIGRIEIGGGNINLIGKSSHFGSYGVYNGSTGSITISGGEISASSSYSNSTTYGVYNKSTGSVTISGGEISASSSYSNSTTYGVYNNSTGSVTISGGEISASSSSSNSTTYGVYNKNTGSITISGGEISASSSSSNSTTNGAYNGSTGTIILGTKDNEVSDISPIIEGKNFGITNSNGILKIYDGIVKGSQGNAIIGEITETEQGYELIKTEEEDREIITLDLLQNSQTEDTVVSVKTEEEIKYYQSLIYGISTVGEEQAIITMMKNTKESISIPNNKNIIIDLNEKAITSQSNRGVDNYGTLEIIGSTGGGTISASTSNGDSYGVYNNDTGSITISGGEISSSSSSGYSYGVYNAGIGSITISGGEISASSSSRYSYGVYNNSTGSITIIGGEISASSSYSYSTTYGVYNNSTGSITISGGTISGGTISASSSSSYGVYNGSTGSVTINGGTITASSSNSSSYGVYNNNSGTIQISEVEINVIVARGYGNSYGVFNNTGIIEISGCNILATTNTGNSNENSYGVCNYGTGSVTISGGTISTNSNVTNSYGVTNNGTAEINGGIISANRKGNSFGNCNSYGVANYGSIVINQGIVTSDEYGIYNNGIAEINGGSITTVLTKVSKLNCGVCNSSNGTVNIGIQGSDVNTIEPTIESQEYGIYNIRGILNIYNGKVKGNLGNAVVGAITETVDGYELVKTEEEGTEVLTLGLLQSEQTENSAVSVKIGETTKYYQSLIYGLSTVKEEQATITLLKDINESISILKDKSVILNLNGKQLSTISQKIECRVINNYGNLQVIDSGENGNIMCETGGNAYGISNFNDGIVTIDNIGMSISANGDYKISYGVYNVGTGSITISGGEISASASAGASYSYGVYNNSTGSITISGGEISASASASASSSYGVYNASTGTINVGTKDGTVNTELPSITVENTSSNGKLYGIYKSNSSGIINFYDGIIKAKTAKYGEFTEVEEGYEYVITVIDGLENLILQEIAQ